MMEMIKKRCKNGDGGERGTVARVMSLSINEEIYRV